MANRIQLSETNLNKLIKTIINEKKQLLNELWVCGDGPAVGSSCGRHGNGAICERFGTMAGYCYCDHTGSCPAESIGPGGRVPTQDNSIRPVSKRPIDNDMARIPHRTLGAQTIQLKESELTRLINRVINEQMTAWPECPKSCQQLIPNFKSRIGQKVSDKPNPCGFLRNRWQSILSQSNQFAQQFQGSNTQTPTVQDRCKADRFTCKLDVLSYQMQQQGGCTPPPRKFHRHRHKR